MPRRRRSAEAVVVEAEAERGLAMRILLRSPKDMVAGVLAGTAIVAIVANALLMQSGPHPSPMFGSVVTLPAPSLASPLPRLRPAEAPRSELSPVETKSAEPKSADIKAPESRTSDPLTNLVKATSTSPVATSSIPRPPAPVPVSARADNNLGTGGSRKVAAVQRALTEYGYGQLKPTGTIGSDTQAAIAKFERDRKIPATGQMSDRMVRELSAMIGHPID